MPAAFPPWPLMCAWLSAAPVTTGGTNSTALMLSDMVFNASAMPLHASLHQAATTYETHAAGCDKHKCYFCSAPYLVHKRNGQKRGCAMHACGAPDMSSPHLPADSMPAAGTNGLASTADAIELVLCAEASDLTDAGEWLSVAATSAAALTAAAVGCAAAEPSACFGVPATHTWPYPQLRSVALPTYM